MIDLLEWTGSLAGLLGAFLLATHTRVRGNIKRYLLRETDSAGYRQRTKLNVRDSDATLIFNTGVLDGGTLQTVRFARTLGNQPSDRCAIRFAAVRAEIDLSFSAENRLWRSSGM